MAEHARAAPWTFRSPVVSVGDGVPETSVELRELALPLALAHALELVEEREDADEARAGQGQCSALFLETRGFAWS